MSNQESIDRLANALTEYREMLPKHPGEQYAFMVRVARKYRIRTAVMNQAVSMLNQIQAEEKQNPTL